MTHGVLDHDHGRTFGRAAEQRMREWVLRSEMQVRPDREETLEDLTQRVHPYVAISRQTGVGAGRIAQGVAKQLGWELLGRELLDEMANRFHLERGRVGAADEASGSWLSESFAKWLDHRIVVASEYVTRLGKLVLLAAHDASAVFLGRGAQFILPRDRGVAVQIVAPLERRIQWVMQFDRLDPSAARRRVMQIDAARHQFIERHFHRDPADASLYDLVINLEFVDRDDAVSLIVARCRKRFELAATGPASN